LKREVKYDEADNIGFGFLAQKSFNPKDLHISEKYFGYSDDESFRSTRGNYSKVNSLIQLVL
jgi:hypothetical protein